MCELGKQILKFFLLWHHLWMMGIGVTSMPFNFNPGRKDRKDWWRKGTWRWKHPSNKKLQVHAARVFFFYHFHWTDAAMWLWGLKSRLLSKHFWPQNLPLRHGLWHPLAQLTPKWIPEKSKFCCRWLMSMWSPFPTKTVPRNRAPLTLSW